MLRRKHRYVSSGAAWRHLGCLAINLLGLRAEVRSVALMSRGSRHHLRSISSGAHATTLARHVTSPIGMMTVMGPLAHDTRDAGAVRAMLSATRTSIARHDMGRCTQTKPPLPADRPTPQSPAGTQACHYTWPCPYGPFPEWALPVAAQTQLIFAHGCPNPTNFCPWLPKPS